LQLSEEVISRITHDSAPVLPNEVAHHLFVNIHGPEGGHLIFAHEAAVTLDRCWFKTLWFDKSLLILNGNFYKNYRHLKGCMVEQKYKIKVTGRIQ